MHYIKSWVLSLLSTLGLIQLPAPEPFDKYGTVTSVNGFSPDLTRFKKVVIVQGDITKQKVDVIVNAANEDLSHGGGVARAISKASGPGLQKYCNAMPAIENGQRCPMGKAVITPAFDLEKIGIKKIIHTTGPRGNTSNKEKLLYDAYYNSLKLAKENGLRSIAFPAISTAIFGYDIQEATPIAFKAVFDFIDQYPDALDEVRFVVFSDADNEVYEKFFSRFMASGE